MALTLNHKLFQGYDNLLSNNERISLLYQRAIHICRTYGLTHEDCLNKTKKYWEFFQHPIMTYDLVIPFMLAGHYNLCLTSVASYVKTRPDLHDLVKKLERWEYCGIFLLTELGHGLDAINLETTATFQTFENGRKGFILHSPNKESYKWTASTSPLGKILKIGIVFAKLIVNGKFKGIRKFVVPLTNGIEMCKGITSKFVGFPEGLPFDCSLTSFDHVELPLNSLLCDNIDIEKEIFSNTTKSTSEIFSESLNLVDTSKLAISFIICGALKKSSFIYGLYSKRRTIIRGKEAKKISILNLRTQQIPLIYALCKINVFEEFIKKATVQLADSSIELNERKAIAAVVKQLVCQETITSLWSQLEKSGAQGVFRHNRFVDTLICCLGMQIAEGEIGVVGLKVASDILLMKYSLPEPKEPTHPLSLHENDLFNETRSLASSFSTDKSQKFEKYILPLCDGLMRAAGFRMAYEYAKEASVNQTILDLFCCIAYEDDPAWYSTKMDLSKSQLQTSRDAAIDAMVPDLEMYITKLSLHEFVNSPIVSESSLQHFHNSLPSFIGQSLEIDLFPLSKL